MISGYVRTCALGRLVIELGRLPWWQRIFVSQLDLTHLANRICDEIEKRGES